jgi:hypothetical protein
MSTPKPPHPSPWASQQSLGARGTQVFLEEGDPRLALAEDAVDWDRDAEAVSAGPHCRFCGSLEALFKLEDGSVACSACCHGQPEQVPRSPLGSGASGTPGDGSEGAA